MSREHVPRTSLEQIRWKRMSIILKFIFQETRIKFVLRAIKVHSFFVTGAGGTVSWQKKNAYDCLQWYKFWGVKTQPKQCLLGGSFGCCFGNPQAWAPIPLNQLLYTSSILTLYSNHIKIFKSVPTWQVQNAPCNIPRIVLYIRI